MRDFVDEMLRKAEALEDSISRAETEHQRRALSIRANACLRLATEVEALLNTGKKTEASDLIRSYHETSKHYCQ